MNRVIEQIHEKIETAVERGDGPLLTYIIGNNGTGKSRILRSLATYYDQTDQSKVRNIACISNGVYDRFPMRGRRLDYLGARSAPNAVFHGAIDRELARYVTWGLAERARFESRFIGTVGARLYATIAPSSASSGKQKPTDVLLQAIDQRKLKNSNVHSVFPSADDRNWLTSILGQEIDILRLTKARARTIATFLGLNPTVTIMVDRPSGRHIFGELSSGEQNRMLMAAKIMSAANNYSLLLIDEPEISLHLHWQIEFHENLKKMLEGLRNLHVVVATHSPIIVSEAAKDKESQNIVVLRAVDNPQARADDETEDSSIAVAGIALSSKHIKSCESLVLDFFNTATYQTKQVVEEVADLVLEASSNPTAIERILDDLNALLSKKGVTRRDLGVVRKASALVKQYLRGSNASTSQ